MVTHRSVKLSELYPNECSGVNRVIEVADLPESGNIAEAVTIDEFKNYARLMGFEDDNESGELPFSSDDSLIEMLLGSARERVEMFTGRSLIAHNWIATIENGTGEMFLPYSNGADVTEVTDCGGNTVESPVVKGSDFKRIDSPFGNITVRYSTSGYCPNGLKLAILIEALYRYENRGDLADEGSLSEKAKTQCFPYQKKIIV